LIGIVVPLPQEASGFGLKARVGEVILGPNLLIAVSGIGREAALRSVEQIVPLGVSRLLSFGTAAALRPELRSGQLLLPRTLLLPSGKAVAVHPPFWSELKARLGPLLPEKGGLLSVGNIVATSDQKRHLRDRTGAVALDMESAFLAEWSAAAGIPFAAIRVVVDRLDQDLPPSLLLSLEREGLSLRRLGGVVVRRPGDLFPLLGLAIAFRKAAKTMEKVARKLCG